MNPACSERALRVQPLYQVSVLWQEAGREASKSNSERLHLNKASQHQKCSKHGGQDSSNNGRVSKNGGSCAHQGESLTILNFGGTVFAGNQTCIQSVTCIVPESIRGRERFQVCLLSKLVHPRGEGFGTPVIRLAPASSRAILTSARFRKHDCVGNT